VATRKKKVKHLKFDTIGGKATVHFGSQVVTISLTIPRKRLTERLLGSDWGHIARLGIKKPRNF
jgi:hypothetical protein